MNHPADALLLPARNHGVTVVLRSVIGDDARYPTDRPVRLIDQPEFEAVQIQFCDPRARVVVLPTNRLTFEDRDARTVALSPCLRPRPARAWRMALVGDQPRHVADFDLGPTFTSASSISAWRPSDD